MKYQQGFARALILEPRLIIADEAISALDASIQGQVVNLLKEIQKEANIALLFIAHDLSMVADYGPIKSTRSVRIRYYAKSPIYRH